MQIAVGGCLAQKDRETIVARAPWVDVVFGTHNIGSLPALLERARVQEQAQVEILESLERFPSVLPARRESAYSAWVAISVGYSSSAFCIVPACAAGRKTAGRATCSPRSGPWSPRAYWRSRCSGRTVNSYGVAFGDRQAFGKLLRACGGIDGLERVRFTSPHPRDFADDVIDAMAQTPNVMPQLHMPLQSGSDAVLQAMRRAYRKGLFLAILDGVRAAMPHAAITTDIIVGFPGETERDFSIPWMSSARPGVLRRVYLPGTRSGRSAPAAAMDGAGSARGSQGAVRPARGAGAGDVPAGEPAAGRPGGGSPRGRWRGAQGRRDAPDVGPGPR